MVFKFLPNKYTSFLSHVDAKGFDPMQCWPWIGAGKGNGYGNVNVKGKTIAASRRSYELFCGEVPDGMDVCHTCDNRWCVNPDHLYAGTRKDNMVDCVIRGRTAGPSRKHLKECEVQEVRRRLLAGHAPRKISVQMGIGYEVITAIKAGKSYVGIGQ
jgi:hypothetical protein